MRLLVYSVLRLVLLAAALGLGYLLGLRSWLLVLVAAVIAALAAYVLLPGPRDAAAAQLAAGLGGRRARGPRPDEDAAYEDAVVDRAAESSEGERDAEQHAVGEFDEAGPAQDDDQVPPARTPEHGAGQAQHRHD